ncbi:hypothetical protein B0H19DRAFT_1292773 [Mycena capillaripes]|nr:hypothetical protein B0H19DRAFT_1292773 [Mycena capillaripes]
MNNPTVVGFMGGDSVSQSVGTVLASTTNADQSTQKRKCPMEDAGDADAVKRQCKAKEKDASGTSDGALKRKTKQSTAGSAEAAPKRKPKNTEDVRDAKHTPAKKSGTDNEARHSAAFDAPVLSNFSSSYNHLHSATVVVPRPPAVGRWLPPTRNQEVIDSLSIGDVRRFRNHIWRQNPLKFIDNSWIDVAALRHFLVAPVLERDVTVISSSPLTQRPIKRESDASNAPGLHLGIKSEPSSVALPVRMRTLTENDRTVIELLDSDSEPDSPAATTIEGFDASSSIPTSPNEHSADNDDDELTMQPSDTHWMDPGISSMAMNIHHELTADICSHVERLEFLTEIPTFWPVPRVPTVFIVDLSHAKWDRALAKHTTDMLIKYKSLMGFQDNDSWHGGTGMGHFRQPPWGTL